MTPPVTQVDAVAPARFAVGERALIARKAGGGSAWAFAKRAFDIGFSTFLVVALAPLLLVMAAAIKLDSRGPVLFRQRRLGRDMQPFTVLKFRTMHDGVSSAAHEAYTRDPRVTHVGGILRKLSIDELPQLFNVMGGTMSLIGPRPALGYELEHYRPHHYERFIVRPGLSGLWQVSGRNQLGFSEMLDLDAEYTLKFGPFTDARIFLRTPVAMVRDAA